MDDITVREEIGKALAASVSEDNAIQSLQRLYHRLTITPEFISYYHEHNADMTPSEPLISEEDYSNMDEYETN
ncbi:MAG: hypothetical protein Q4F05_09960 [bacterium]|nr:hypothetical protein [bacterium]